MKKVFLDTETTGLSPGSIAQLAMIVDNNNEITAKNYFFEVQGMTEGAMKACGRDETFYKQASGGQKFKDRADEIYNELTDSIIIGHNVKFDINFLSAEFWRENKLFKPAQTFDTMEYFTDICKIPYKYASKHGKYKHPKLEELINFFRIKWNCVDEYTKQMFNLQDSDITGLHDAQYDTTAMFIAFQVYNEQMHNTQTGWRANFVG